MLSTFTSNRLESGKFKHMTATPNILFIHVDQQRFDSLGRSGHPLVKTPHLDQLASEGMWFERSFTPIPLCCPARQTLLCSQWPHHHGGLWNYDITLPVNLFEGPSWTQDLQRAGWNQSYIGKWHVHPTKTPLDFGVDEYISEDDYRQWRHPQNLPGYQIDEQALWLGGTDPVAPELTQTHWFAGKAIDAIDRYREQDAPWMVRLDFPEPHLPCVPAQEFLDLYPIDAIEPWGNQHDSLEGKPYIQRQQRVSWGIDAWGWDEWSRYLQRYFAMISQIDDAVGGVLKHLDQCSLRDDTIVVYTTDHGDAAGSHGMIDKHYVMYEEEVRVPLIVRWPGRIEAGSVCDDFVLNELDLGPTFLEMAGLAIPDHCQGRSLVPLLQGQTPDDWRQAAVSCYNGQQFGLYNQRMIRNERWKYIWNPTDCDELYDLLDDPWELTNRVNDISCSKLMGDLRSQLHEALTEQGDTIFRTPSMQGQLLEGRKLS